MAERSLEVTIISAKGLNKVNLVGKMDVYAVAYINGAVNQDQKQKTPVDKDGDSNPTWNHSMKFKIDEAAALNNKLTLVVKIKTEGMLGDKDVGEVHVPVKELLEGALTGIKPLQFVSYQVRKPSGKPKGELNFSYKFGEKPAGEVPVTAYPAGKVNKPDEAAMSHPAGNGYPAAAAPSGSSSMYPPVDVGPGVYPPPAAAAAPGPYPPAPPAGYPQVPAPAGYSQAPAGYPQAPAGYPQAPTGHSDAPKAVGHPDAPKAAEHPEVPTGYPQAPVGYPYQHQQGYGGYPPVQPPGYGGYPPQPGYGGFPPYPGYGGYPPQPAYGYPPVVQPQQTQKKSKFGTRLGVGLLGGALGGLLIGDVVSDAASGCGSGCGGGGCGGS
ncbi:uncharacterized protein LOC143549903 [Bidens hawaiensis]|uniref:uncharacterized protein LOC143549903 n=1 Tax=Bidens hawaiensis TaxID=980011 RepID=UPI0040498FC1